MKTYKITVMTPTYNRGHLLPQLYESLRQQTFKDFQWLIVDDGSTDQTLNLVANWMSQVNDFEILYLKVKNGGKHRAINKATELAQGELFFIVDSDDYLIPTALEKIISWEATLGIDEKKTFAGIAGCKGTDSETLVGTTFEGDYLDATALERDKYQIDGDKAEVFYTQLLRKYKFPEIEGENFMTEFVVWFHLAHDGYKIRWFNDIIYICNYLEDGLTKNAASIAQKNPKGYQLASQLYQKFYGHYLLQEKTKTISNLRQTIENGQVLNVDLLFEQLPPLLQKDLELQLLFIQAHVKQNNFEKAMLWIDKLQIIYPKSKAVYLQLATLGEITGDSDLEIRGLQKAFLYNQEPELRQKLLDKLLLKHQLQESQILAYNYEKILGFYKNKQLQQCIDLILLDSGFDEILQHELLALADRPLLREVLVRLIIGEIEGVTVDQGDLPYVYGHLYYDLGAYDQSLSYLKQIPKQSLTPLTTYRLTKLSLLTGTGDLKEN